MVSPRVFGLIYGGEMVNPLTRRYEVPSSQVVRKQCEALGCWSEFVGRRSQYRLEGLNAQESKIRVYKELKIGERFRDINYRETKAVVSGSNVPLTPKETKALHPEYKSPAVVDAPICDPPLVMSLSEQLQWVWDARGRFQNGGETPSEFPNASVVSWWHDALRDAAGFRTAYMKTASPSLSDDSGLQDAEYQFGEIEKQLGQALEECGRKLVQQESSFAEALREYSLSAEVLDSTIQPTQV